MSAARNLEVAGIPKHDNPFEVKISTPSWADQDGESDEEMFTGSPPITTTDPGAGMFSVQADDEEEGGAAANWTEEKNKNKNKIRKNNRGRGPPVQEQEDEKEEQPQRRVLNLKTKKTFRKFEKDEWERIISETFIETVPLCNRFIAAYFLWIAMSMRTQKIICVAIRNLSNLAVQKMVEGEAIRNAILYAVYCVNLVKGGNYHNITKEMSNILMNEGVVEFAKRYGITVENVHAVLDEILEKLVFTTSIYIGGKKVTDVRDVTFNDIESRIHAESSNQPFPEMELDEMCFIVGSKTIQNMNGSTGKQLILTAFKKKEKPIDAEPILSNKKNFPAFGTAVSVPAIPPRISYVAVAKTEESVPQPHQAAQPVQTGQVQPHQVQTHQVQPHQVQTHQVQPHQVQPHQVQPHQVQPHQVQSHQVQPHQVQPQVQSHQVQTGQGIQLPQPVASTFNGLHLMASKYMLQDGVYGLTGSMTIGSTVIKLYTYKFGEQTSVPQPKVGDKYWTLDHNFSHNIIIWILQKNSEGKWEFVFNQEFVIDSIGTVEYNGQFYFWNNSMMNFVVLEDL